MQHQCYHGEQSPHQNHYESFQQFQLLFCSGYSKAVMSNVMYGPHAAHLVSQCSPQFNFNIRNKTKNLVWASGRLGWLGWCVCLRERPGGTIWLVQGLMCQEITSEIGTSTQMESVKHEKKTWREFVKSSKESDLKDREQRDHEREMGTSEEVSEQIWQFLSLLW